MSKTIVLIHGRHYKPAENELRKLWFEALEYGIERDYSAVKLQEFKDTNLEFAYYGDLSNKFLKEASIDYEAGSQAKDLTDRKKALQALKQYSKNDFRKDVYKKLPNVNPFMEFAANLLDGPLDLFNFDEAAIGRQAPDIANYWNDCMYGSDLRKRFTDIVVQAMKRKDEICVISHSLGTMIAYDVFWKMSYYSEYRYENWNKHIDLWITMGSPLANGTVMNNLKGVRCSSKERYPNNVRKWVNISAEDDYISHKRRVAGPYQMMKKGGGTESITDEFIYNLSVRLGRSYPHHGTGYLIHPKTARAIAEWL